MLLLGHLALLTCHPPLHEVGAMPGAGQGLPPPTATVSRDSPAPAPASRSGPRLGRLARGGTWGIAGTCGVGPAPCPALAPQKQVSTLPKTGAQARARSPRLPARAPALGSAWLPATETSSLTCTEMGSSLHHKLTVNPVPYNTSGFHHLTMAELEVLFPPSFLVASLRAWHVSPFNCKLQKRMKELARKHVIQP